MKRLLVQISTFIVTNLNVKGFFTGKIFQGESKYICVPGLNCYSCPGSLGSCPIGSLQAVIGSAKYHVSLYILGFLVLLGTLLGRVICGWLCPFGLIQDLIYRIKVRKRELPQRADRPLRMLKYVILAVMVILLPMVLTNAFGIAPPYFCQYICPSGTLFGGFPLLAANPSLRQAVGFLFSWKTALLLLFLMSSLFIFRPFCKYICPLGAIYALFNKISIYRMHIDREACTNCGKCEKVCPMQVPVLKNSNHSECIRCGKCKSACPSAAIRSGIRTKEGSCPSICRKEKREE